MTTKISISLADETVEALDRFIVQRKFASRSSAIKAAIDQMTSVDLTDEYARAHREWQSLVKKMCGVRLQETV